jgi:outer membrane receptor protein involved in Fe transport
VGGDQAYQDGAILFYSLTPAGTRGDTVRADKREGALNMGAFLQEELAFGARWLLTLGARFDDISYYYQDFLDPKLDADKAFRGVTPKLGRRWGAASKRPPATRLTRRARLGRTPSP